MGSGPSIILLPGKVEIETSATDWLFVASGEIVNKVRLTSPIFERGCIITKCIIRSRVWKHKLDSWENMRIEPGDAIEFPPGNLRLRLGYPN